MFQISRRLLFQFSGFLKGEYEEEIIDCIRLLLGANHKDIYRRACAVLQAILAARLGPSVEPTSRPASYSHLSLQQYVPILVSSTQCQRILSQLHLRAFACSSALLYSHVQLF